MPTATLEEPLVPIFMYHRYAVESAASMVAGQDSSTRCARQPDTNEGRRRRRPAQGARRAGVHAAAAELTVPKIALDMITPPAAGWACIASCLRGRRATRSIR